MVNMTLALPKELHEVMRKHPEIKWSEVARRAMQEYVEKIELLDKLTAKSRLMEQDVDRISHTVKTAILRHYRKHLHETRG